MGENASPETNETEEMVEVTYEVTVRVPTDAPAPLESDMRMAVDHLRNEVSGAYKEMTVFSVRRL